MKPLFLLPLLAFASTTFAQTQAYVDQTSFVTKDGQVYTIDPSSAFEVRHGGHFRGRLIYATQNFDATSGQFIQPDLVPIWSVRNEDLGFVGSGEWLGDDVNQEALTPLTFDPATGLGTATMEIPMGQMINDITYANLPHGDAHLFLGFGTAGQLGINGAGIPVNYDHWSIFSFKTDYPDVLTFSEKTQISVGEKNNFTVIMENSTPVDDVLTFQVVGNARMQLIDGGPINSWSLPIKAGTRAYALDLVARSTGSFFVRASLSNGSYADGAWIQVSGAADNSAQASDGAFLGGGGGGRGEGGGGGNGGEGGEEDTDQTSGEYVSGKVCLLGRCSPNGGDRLLDCTSTFVDAIGPPPNPNCKGPNVGIVQHGGCRKGEESCMELGEQSFTCPKYKYAGTVDREVGSTTVGAKVSISGEVNYLIGKAKTTGEVSGSVTSKVSRRCCKYVPVPGETVKVKIKTCQ